MNVYEVSREYIGIVVFCIRDYISRIRVRSILMKFLETSDCTDVSRKDETCLQFKMNKYFIKTRKEKKISQIMDDHSCEDKR